MSVSVESVLGLLLLLEVKHFLGDYVLTTAYMMRNRRHYGHPGGLLHVAVHIAGTAAALLVVPAFGAPAIGAATLLAMILAEGVLHYHIDWSKDRLVQRWALTPLQRGYWVLAGLDQLLHQITYLGLALWWATAIVR